MDEAKAQAHAESNDSGGSEVDWCPPRHNVFMKTAVVSVALVVVFGAPDDGLCTRPPYGRGEFSRVSSNERVCSRDDIEYYDHCLRRQHCYGAAE
jgi:hypothetical protein